MSVTTAAAKGVEDSLIQTLEGGRALPISGISIYLTHCWPLFPSSLPSDVAAPTHN